MARGSSKVSSLRRKEWQACGFVALSHRTPDASMLPEEQGGDRFRVGRRILDGITALQHRGLASSGMALGRFHPSRRGGEESPGKIVNVRNLGKLNADFTKPVPGFEDAKNFDDLTLSVDHVRGGLAHVRYVTTGSKDVRNAQPFPQGVESNPLFSLAFNGNILNYHSLVEELSKDGWRPQTNVDTELISELVKRGIEKAGGSTPPIVAGLKYAMSKLKGAYSGAVYTRDGETVAFRDFLGFRPAVIGKLHKRHVFASETIALDAMDAHFERVVNPGEVYYVDANGASKSFQLERPKDFPQGLQHCIFEALYFMHHNSIVAGLPVWLLRARFGSALAQDVYRNVSEYSPYLHKKLAQAAKGKTPQDVLVMPVPRSGIPQAAGLAMALGLTLSQQPGRDAELFKNAWKIQDDESQPKPVRDFAKAFLKHPISNASAMWRKPDRDRTFIADEEVRDEKLEDKFGFNGRQIKGKHVILVDDSIVRGATMLKLVKKIRGYGAKSVHVVTTAPPIIATCYMGVAMNSGEYVAESVLSKEGVGNINQKTGLSQHILTSLHPTFERDVAQAIGADTVTYANIPEMLKTAGVVSGESSKFCTSCFTGGYVFPIEKQPLVTKEILITSKPPKRH